MVSCIVIGLPRHVVDKPRLVYTKPGMGKTTCAFFQPGTMNIMFASTHLDPRSKDLQKEELDFRASGKQRRYAWDYDAEMDIFVADAKTNALTRLTSAKGYDAEGSYSPDGQWIVFSRLDAANKGQLCRMPLAGGAETVLTPYIEGVQQAHPTWSLDDQTIYYSYYDRVTNGLRGSSRLLLPPAGDEEEGSESPEPTGGA